MPEIRCRRISLEWPAPHSPFAARFAVCLSPSARISRCRRTRRPTATSTRTAQTPRSTKMASLRFVACSPGSYTLSLAVSGDARSPQGNNTGQTVEITNANVEGLRVAPAPSGNVHGPFRKDSGQTIDWSQMIVDLDLDEDSESAGRITVGRTVTRSKARDPLNSRMCLLGLITWLPGLERKHCEIIL
jgi:hypothetical protein